MPAPDVARRAERALLIAFLDLTRFHSQVGRRSDLEVADLLEAFYERVSAGVTASGGRVVKWMGDGALIVWPEDAVDAGARALLELKEGVDAWMSELGWPCRLQAKAHYGSAVAGPIADSAFDVIGKAVNTAALMKTHGVSLSPQAFRKLAPETRKAFRKHTPPIRYIRSDDPHQD